MSERRASNPAVNHLSGCRPFDDLREALRRPISHLMCRLLGHRHVEGLWHLVSPRHWEREIACRRCGYVLLSQGTTSDAKPLEIWS